MRYSAHALTGLIVLLASRHSWAQPAYLLRDISPGNEGTTFSRTFTPIQAPSSGGRVERRLRFFTHRFFTDPSLLWETAGTPATTGELVEVPGGCEAIRFGEVCYPDFLTANGYFATTDPEHGVELWRTDGTPEGTGLVKDIRPGPASSLHESGSIGFFGQLTEIAGPLLFVADDGVHGHALWTSSGTAETTRLIRDFPERAGARIGGLMNVDPEGLGFFVLSSASGQPGDEVWASLGTEDSTKRIAAFDHVLSPFVPHDGDVFFLAAGAEGLGLWKAPVIGFPEVNPALLVSRLPGSLSSGQGMVLVDGTVYFTLEDASLAPRPVSLWASDGAAENTRALKTVVGGSIDELTGVRGTLFFRLIDRSIGHQLWKSDGTAGGTVLVKPFGPGTDRALRDLTPGNHALYFSANETPSGEFRLWTSDGTAAGTVIVAGESRSPEQLTAAGDFLYWIDADLAHSYEMRTLPLRSTCDDAGVEDVIMDNPDSRTRSTGSWQVSSAPGAFGAGSVWSRPSSRGIPAFTFPAELPVDGRYKVFEWHSVFASRTRAARHVIGHRGGTATLFVDQSRGGGRWNQLGAYDFPSAGSVTILAEDGVRSTNADAVRFVCEEPARPVARIDGIAPRPAKEGKSVCFQGHGEPVPGGDPRHSIVAYEWSSSVQPEGLLSDRPSFCATDLVPGLHAIVFRVREESGNWSPPAVDALEVRPAVTEFIVDNRYPGSPTGGAWQVSGSPGHFAIDSVWAKPTLGKGSIPFSFPATLPSGRYELYEWHTVWPTRSRAVEHEVIQRDGGRASITVDQSVNGGRWNLLGAFSLAGEVTVRILARDTARSTNADAVRFVWKSFE